jgi:hypothetical protein
MCYDCNPPKVGSALAFVPAPAPPPRDPAWLVNEPSNAHAGAPVEPVERVPGHMENTTQSELEHLGYENSIDGAILLRMARALDDPDLPGAQIASLSKILKAQLAEMRASAPPEDDDLDSMEKEMQEKLLRRL